MAFSRCGQRLQETPTNAFSADVGLAMGLGKLVARELVGVYEFVTAPFAVPENYEPVLQPEFPWQYFESEPGRVYGFSDSYLSEEAYQLNRISGAVIERRAGALVVRFPDDMLFPVGSAQLSKPAQVRLQEVARVLRNTPKAQVLVRLHRFDGRAGIQKGFSRSARRRYGNIGQTGVARSGSSSPASRRRPGASNTPGVAG